MFFYRETPSTKHEIGIKSMLSRLKRQRDFNIGFGVRENHEDYSTAFSAGYNNGKADWQFSRFSTDSTVSLSIVLGILQKKKKKKCK